MREHTLLEHHASATGMTCLPSARPGHLLRSGGSELGRDGAAYLSYRLTCCETTVCRVTDCFGVWLVPLVSVVGSVGCQSISHLILFSCFLVEGSRLSSPLSGRVEILNHSKETNWSQHSSSTVDPVNKVSHYSSVANRSLHFYEVRPSLLTHCFTVPSSAPPWGGRRSAVAI